MLSADQVGKARGVGRLVSMSAIGGVLVAAIWLPVAGSVGLFAKTELNKFNSLSTQALHQVPQRSEILDRYGHVLAYIYNVDASYYYSSSNIKVVTASGIDRAPVAFDQIAPAMRQAVVAIEDSRYYQHGALDFRGTVRALINNLQHKPVQGGSTIAQQYVKNVLILTAPNPQQATAATTDTLSRKLHELRLAIAVEHQMSRNDILAGYLNDAYFGNLAVGVEVAAQTYFNTTAAKLTLPQAAMLAGIVENPSAYDPIASPGPARDRRNIVLSRMAQLGMISNAAAAAAEKTPLGLTPTAQPNGCASPSASYAAFFCDYVVQSFLRDGQLGKTPADRARLLANGGLRIYTTLDPRTQRAADHAVNYWVPGRGGPGNPGHNADTEAVVQPGTGQIRAIAEDRPYGTRGYATTINYAVDTAYNGGVGIQAGSSAKLFTLITALEQGVPFGFTQTVPYQETISGFYDCSGQFLAPWHLNNATNSDRGTFSLYTGTTQSINTYYAGLEKKVGLCNVVKTAAALGLHRADGTALLKSGGPSEPPADQLTSFTLGPVNVSPLSMAAAYATVAARGMYCAPVAISKIITDANRSLPVPSAGCHRAIPQAIADAVNYILQGVLINGTAGGEGIGRPAAGKTGTGDGPHYVDFGGYTPTLASYTSVFFPASPQTHPMVGLQACYQGGCPGTMFGANAPAQTWQMTFERANLGPPLAFVPVDPNSPLFSLGNGQTVKQPKPKQPSPPAGGGGGGGHCPKFLPVCQHH